MENTKIEWSHHTFNPWHGCTKVSPACKNCYAETMAKRRGDDVWGEDKPRLFMTDDYWQEPIKWQRDAEILRQRRRVFCASMADLFEDRRDLDESRVRLWRLIERTGALDWLILSKRPENMRDMTPWPIRWPANAWAMTTAETQEYLEVRWDHLRRVPSRVLGLSIEPMLSEIDLRPVIQTKPSGAELWVIAGGESGPDPRPTNPAWFEGLRDQCQAGGVPFFFKQWGVLPREASPTGKRLSKKAAGRELSGRSWDEFPRCGIGGE